MRKNIFVSILIVILLLMFALSLRSINLNKEFSGDENMIITISGKTLKEGIDYLGKMDVYPPLTYLLSHYLMKLGSSPVLIRFYFVAFGIGSCYLIYLLAKEYLDIKLARLAMLLSAVSPLLIFISQYVRSYSDSTFWMLASSVFFLKIIRGKGRLLHWIAYLAASVMSMYTFYFSMLLILTQFLFVTIFMFREKRLLLKWYMMFSLLFLVFFPWVPVVIGQFSKAAGMHYDWSEKGFNIGIFRAGLYTRNIFGVIGLDPSFMSFSGGISHHYAKSILLGIVTVSFFAFLLFFYFTIKFLKSRFAGDDVSVWFFPFFIVAPLLISWVSAGLVNAIPNAKYFATMHAFFLIMVAFFFYSLWERKKSLAIVCCVFFMGVYLVRYPYAIAQEVELKKAESFLKKMPIEDDCVLCVRSCPDRVVSANIINMSNCLALKEDRSEYRIISNGQCDEFKEKILSFKRVWFYRVNGNVEVFGGNSLLADWLDSKGYKQESVNKFKNIDVIEFTKY